MILESIVLSRPFFITFLAASLLSGCASSPLTAENINRYDGWWTAKIQKTPETQHANGWRQKCSNLEGEFSFEVQDGVVLMNILGASQEQALSSRGTFKIKQITDFHVSAAVSSDVNIFDGRVTYIIKGKLNGAKPRGSITDWVPEIGAGCITKINYIRESE